MHLLMLKNEHAEVNIHDKFKTLLDEKLRQSINRIKLSLKIFMLVNAIF